MDRPALVALLVVALVPTTIRAQDPARPRSGLTERADSAEEAALHAAAVASTVDAADTIRRAVEIDAARRLAPFDLDWGTP